MGRTVSRVLFRRQAGRMVICLGRPSPIASSSLPAATDRIPEGTGRGAVWVTPRRLFGLAPTGGYRAAPVTGSAVGSYPTLSPLPVVRLRARRAVCFLLPCPSPCGAQALPGSLPDGARTFLERRSARDHHVRPDRNLTADTRKRKNQGRKRQRRKTNRGPVSLLILPLLSSPPLVFPLSCIRS